MSTERIDSTDPRIKLLSYSSLLTLHQCPRKYQLYKVTDTSSLAELVDDEAPVQNLSQSVTFAFGHIVGEGIQLIFQGLPLEEIYWRLFLMWDADLAAANDKQNKSFYKGLQAVTQLHSMRSNGYLSEWDVVIHEGKPACEMTFAIEFPDGFLYRGSVDAVLQNKLTGEVRVLELKTSSATSLHPAQYKNSAQAVGYSIVLDHLFPELSSYDVLYLIHQTKKEEFTQFVFPKSYYQRALWIQECLLDIETIKLYEDTGVYPTHGESCMDFYTPCEYYQVCGLPTERMMSDYDPDKLAADLEKYTIKVTLSNLLQAQERKAPSAQVE